MRNWKEELAIWAGLLLVTMMVVTRMASGQALALDASAIEKTAVKSFRVDGIKVLANTGKILEPSMVGADTVAKIDYDTCDGAIEESTDSTTIVVVKSTSRSIKWDVVNDAKKDLVYTGKFAKELANFFYVGDLVNVKTGEKQASNAEINYKGGTYTVTIPQGWKLDPGYSVAPGAVTAAFNLDGSGNDTEDSTANKIAETNLVAYYTFNTDGTDEMGNYNATLNDGAAVQDTNTRVGAGAAVIDADNDDISCGDISELDNTQNFTVCMWGWQQEQDDTHYYFNKRAPSDNSNAIYPYSTGGALRWYIANGVASHVLVSDISAYVDDQTWHHFAFWYDGTQTGNANRAKVYVDGVSVADDSSLNIPSATDASMEDFYIGNTSTSGGGGFYGLVDEFKVYTVSLTEQQIRTIYAAERERFVKDTTEGSVIIDSAWNNTELDTVIFNIGADTLKHAMADGLVDDISSLLTADDDNTVIITGANNVGRGGTVAHTVYYTSAYSAGYDTTYRDTTSRTACINTDTLYTILSDSVQIDSVNISPNDDTTSNWLVEFREDIDTTKTDPTRDTVSFVSDTTETLYGSDTTESAKVDSLLDTVTTSAAGGEDTTFTYYFKRWFHHVCSTQTDSTHYVLRVDSVSRVLSACEGNPVTARDTFDNDDEYYEDSTATATKLCQDTIYDTLYSDAGDTIRIDTVVVGQDFGIYKNRFYKNKIYYNKTYKQPIWKGRDYEW